jgi:hemerythrin
LFKLVNTVLAAKDKGALTSCAMALFQYTREHFAHEEQLMKRLNYPAMAEHQTQHDNLISRLSEVSARIANDTLNHLVLEAFLSDWLLNHIATSDVKLAAYIQANSA